MQLYFTLLNTTSKHYANYRNTGSIKGRTSIYFVADNYIKQFDAIFTQAVTSAVDVGAAYTLQKYIKHIDEQSKLRRKPGATGPRHLDSSKIKVLKLSPTQGLTFEIAIPGIRRAYQDITIYPKRSKYLAIPMKPQYGAARTFAKDLFFYKTKAGNKALAYVSSGKLVVTHILKESVFQPRDPTLLPNRKEVIIETSYVIQTALANNLKKAVQAVGQSKFTTVFSDNRTRRYATDPMLNLYSSRLTNYNYIY